MLCGLLIFGCWLAWQPARADNRLPPTVSQALAAARIPVGAVGLVVQEAGKSPPRLELNPDQPMNPASVMKLLTTFAALEILGPGYTWTTSAWGSSPVEGDLLPGDLILQGSGDPKFTLEQFWLLLRQIRARGIRRIAGDLILDTGIFATSPHDPSAFDDKPFRPYNVGPDALLLNFKSIRLALHPEPTNKIVSIAAEPELANLEILNLIETTNGSCGEWKDGLRADLAHQGQAWRLTLTGRYPAACADKHWHLSVLSHPDYIRGVFESLWRELGGTFSGKARIGAVPPTARQLAYIDSPTLAEQVRDINKFSNNVMARQLFLNLSAKRPASAADAEVATRAWLVNRDLNFPELTLDNGSGLSRRERLSANSLARLLNAAWRSPVMPELMASLPLAAVDGTMRKRLTNQGVAGQAHIKTGSLEGVKTIAGYIQDRFGQYQIVVFMVNHPNAQAAQAAQDALLSWVYEGGR